MNFAATLVAFACSVLVFLPSATFGHSGPVQNPRDVQYEYAGVRYPSLQALRAAQGFNLAGSSVSSDPSKSARPLTARTAPVLHHGQQEQQQQEEEPQRESHQRPNVNIPIPQRVAVVKRACERCEPVVAQATPEAAQQTATQVGRGKVLDDAGISEAHLCKAHPDCAHLGSPDTPCCPTRGGVMMGCCDESLMKAAGIVAVAELQTAVPDSHNDTCEARKPEPTVAAQVSEVSVSDGIGSCLAVGVLAVALVTAFFCCVKLQQKLTTVQQRLTRAEHELHVASDAAARLDNACRAGLDPGHEPLMKVTGSIGQLGKDFDWVVHDVEHSKRVIKVQCPGVSRVNVEIEIIFNGCVPTIWRPGSEGVEPATWSRCFQFHPSDGLFAFREDLVVLDQGILQMVFEPVHARGYGHVFRFPELFCISDGEAGEMTMMAEQSADCAAGRSPMLASPTPVASPVHPQEKTLIMTPSATSPDVGFTTPPLSLPNSALRTQRLDSGHRHLKFGTPLGRRDAASSPSNAACTEQPSATRVAASRWPPARRQSM